MNLLKLYQKNSTWYKGAFTGSEPVGVLWHDTAGGNPTLKRYVQPHESYDKDYNEWIQKLGKNKYGNDWNHVEHDAGLNAWIGQLADGSMATIQTGPWDMAPWGCGSGSKGSCNGYFIPRTTKWCGKHWIQFEICDDGYKDKTYFEKAYKEAVEFTAYLCDLFNIDPNGTVEFNGVTVPTILCHADSYKLKLGGNHGDVYSWFGTLGKAKNMNKVREDVTAELKKTYNKVLESKEPTERKFNVLDEVKIRSGVTKYANGQNMASWVPNAKLYVRWYETATTVAVSTLKGEKDAITGIVNESDIVLVKAVKQEESVQTPKPVVTVKGTPSTGSDADIKKMWDFLLKEYQNEFGVAGLMGNINAESAFKSNNLQQTYEKKLGYSDTTYTTAVDNGSYTNFVKDSAGYGLAQWTFWSRKEQLLNFAKSKKISIGDFDMQLEFLVKEIKSYKQVDTLLRTAKSVREASDIVLHSYEAPADQSEAVEIKRAGYGQSYYDKYAVKKPEKEELKVEAPVETPPVTELPENPPTTEEPKTEDPKKESPEKQEPTVTEPKEDNPVEIPEETEKELSNAFIKFFKKLINIIAKLFKK